MLHGADSPLRLMSQTIPILVLGSLALETTCRLVKEEMVHHLPDLNLLIWAAERSPLIDTDVQGITKLDLTLALKV